MSVSNDLSCLTNIENKDIDKFIDKLVIYICHLILESINQNKEYAEIDIGIGTLYIKEEDNNVFYKFRPSNSLEDKIVDTIKNKKDPLISSLEKSLIDRIRNSYKELF